MLDEKDLMLALKRHWDYSGMDEDVSHEIYHDDAVLEFPQSGEQFEGVENSGSPDPTNTGPGKCSSPALSRRAPQTKGFAARRR